MASSDSMHKWLVLIAVAACGDNLKPPPADAPDDHILERLQALPNVADATEMPTTTPGFHYIVLHFTQPVDHHDPTSPTFLQEVSLLHKDVSLPLTVHTSGYSDYYKDREVELTAMLGGNQISIEHRYFGTSIPSPADWTKLTIEQMAYDEHEIVSALRTIYTGPAISTGGSKGGMTAVFYRRFFPDDVDGTVPYVAPIMFSLHDPRFPPLIETLGPQACHDAVRAVAVEMITNRRAALEAATQAQATQSGYTYTRVAIGPAVESAIESLEWQFWQYYGVNYCDRVPAVDATDDDMFKFLDAISAPKDADDAQCAFFQGWAWQLFAQLGYPDDDTTYLKPYYMYGDADYLGELPTGVEPPYDNAVAMHDIDDFVQHSGSRFLFVYGQWDPWSGGQYQLGSASDSLVLVQAQGTHDSRIGTLSPDDNAAATALLAGWTGLSIHPVTRAMPEPRLPRLVRPLRAR